MGSFWHVTFFETPFSIFWICHYNIAIWTCIYSLSCQISAFNVQGVKKGYFSMWETLQAKHTFCETVVSKQWLSRGWDEDGILPSICSLAVEVFWIPVISWSSNSSRHTVKTLLYNVFVGLYFLNETVYTSKVKPECRATPVVLE